MKRLIAVITCHSYQYKHAVGGAHQDGENLLRADAIRNTWYKDWSKYKDEIDLKFFYGRWPSEATRLSGPNEIFLDCGDDYYSLPEKVQKVNQWALERGYDRLLKVDDDVFLYVSRLVSDTRNDDYRGFEVEAVIGRYASGTAYWLSRKSMELVARTEWNQNQPAEDQWVGSVLAKNGIFVTHDERFHCCRCDSCLKKFPEETRLSSHTYNPNEMYKLWQTIS